MHTIDLAYVGRGIHEELVAYVADQECYFEDEGVHVALRDGTRWDITRVRSSATIGLGRAVLSRLTDGFEWTVLEHEHRPSIVLVSRQRRSDIDGGPSRAPARRTRAKYSARVLRAHRAASARPGPRPRRAMRGAASG